MHHQIIINNTEKLFTTNLKKRKQKWELKTRLKLLWSLKQKENKESRLEQEKRKTNH